MGIMLKLDAEGKSTSLTTTSSRSIHAVADRENFIHIHDKDFSLITFNCQIDLLKLFRGGFSTGHGFLREPDSIRAYASLACIAIQSNQNDMFGGRNIQRVRLCDGGRREKSFRKAIVEEASGRHCSTASDAGISHMTHSKGTACGARLCRVHLRGKAGR